MNDVFRSVATSVQTAGHWAVMSREWASRARRRVVVLGEYMVFDVCVCVRGCVCVCVPGLLKGMR